MIAQFEPDVYQRLAIRPVELSLCVWTITNFCSPGHLDKTFFLADDGKNAPERMRCLVDLLIGLSANNIKNGNYIRGLSF